MIAEKPSAYYHRHTNSLAIAIYKSYSYVDSETDMSFSVCFALWALVVI